MGRHGNGLRRILTERVRRPRALRWRRLSLEALEPRHVLSAANLLISEFMASNSGTLADGDGRFSDWIEVQNSSGAAVNLSNYFLTDTAADLRRWAFPS